MGFRLHRSRRRKPIDEKIDDQGGSDKIEHDGGDDNVAAAFGLQIAGHESPGRPECSSSNSGKDKNERPREKIEIKADESYTKSGYISLAFGSNVEKPGVKCDGKSKAGKNKIGCVKQRVAKPLGLPKCALNDNSGCSQWIFADGDQKNGG